MFAFNPPDVYPVLVPVLTGLLGFAVGSPFRFCRLVRAAFGGDLWP